MEWSFPDVVGSAYLYLPPGAARHYRATHNAHDSDENLRLLLLAAMSNACFLHEFLDSVPKIDNIHLLRSLRCLCCVLCLEFCPAEGPSR